MHVPEADHAGRQLRNDRRDRRTGHAHAERRHEQQIKHHIEERRDQQEIQRRPAVAQRAQKRRRNVIPKLEHQPRGIDAEVQNRLRQQRLRRAEEAAQQKLRAQKPDRAHHKSHRQHQHDRCRGIPAQLFGPPGAKILRDENARANGEAQRQRRKQDRQRRARADSRERLLPLKIADDNGIRRIIELLQQVSQHDRQRKLQNKLPGRAPGQVLCHDIPLQIDSSYIVT